MSDTETPIETESIETETIEIDEDAELYDLQRHRNGDETALLLLGFADGYQILALDVNAGGEILETEIVGSSPERSKAVGMAEYWLDQHPDGVLGGADEDGGFLAGLFGGD